MPASVSRDGRVTLNGTHIGNLVKRPRETMTSAILGIESGSFEWVPTLPDGTALSRAYDTRKRALAILEQATRPARVESLRTESTWGPPDECVTASVYVRGNYFGVSRYPRESYWVVDCFTPLGSIMPHWSNGTGTRVTRATILRGEAADLVTRAAIEAGLLPGRDPGGTPAADVSPVDPDAITGGPGFAEYNHGR